MQALGAAIDQDLEKPPFHLIGDGDDNFIDAVVGDQVQQTLAIAEHRQPGDRLSLLPRVIIDEADDGIPRLLLLLQHLGEGAPSPPGADHQHAALELGQAEEGGVGIAPEPHEQQRRAGEEEEKEPGQGLRGENKVGQQVSERQCHQGEEQLAQHRQPPPGHIDVVEIEEPAHAPPGRRQQGEPAPVLPHKVPGKHRAVHRAPRPEAKEHGAVDQNSIYEE